MGELGVPLSSGLRPVSDRDRTTAIEFDAETKARLAARLRKLDECRAASLARSATYPILRGGKENSGG